MKTLQPSPKNTLELYTKIRRGRPQWFEKSINRPAEDFIGFENWIFSVVSFWYDGGDNLVMVNRSGHVAEIHPIFLGPINQVFLQEVLDDMEKIAIHRVEVPLLYKNGQSIRRMLRVLGFLQEGILRHKEYFKAINGSASSFIDVELWAKLLPVRGA